MKLFTVILSLLFSVTSCINKHKPLYLTGIQWMSLEIDFVSNNDYADCFNDVNLDVIFQHSNGETLKIPAFWDGGKSWKVRFAPTRSGRWEFKTICNDVSNSGLHGKSGKIKVSSYQGDLEIFKHGFLKTLPEIRYFVYNDNTPFFYIGDTHWGMPSELIDSSSIPGYSSHFKYIVDKRVEQGFTVYQSEPIGAKYNLSDGLNEHDIDGFKDLDRRFQYIAQRGLIHANAQLVFSTALGANREKYPDSYLEKLCRYWVARYSSYPVLWTTAQEVDNDCYHGRIWDGKDMNPFFDENTNPWKLVASYIHKYDPYKHALTAHMEFSSIGGDGTVASTSSFRDLPGHSWYAAQWSPAINTQLDFQIPKDFWESGQGKPVVNFEGLYDHLWTNHFGARMQGWTAFLNGMYGHGYGAADIWLYNSDYDMEKESNHHGIKITVEDKKTKWDKSVEFASAWQMGIMRRFFESIDWWDLTPRFDDEAWFENDSSFYSIASKENELYVAYFYNKTLKTGIIKGLDNSEYVCQWFNPVNGKYLDSNRIQIQNRLYDIGNKPDEMDWILILKKSGQ